ncbi:serine hydrolase [Desulfogranum marinum]|uniref:D-alanyl-D-alanine carboxypeptidase family protein n=1 Tax=Desulfogranum marinum TaxID=453220 RepID=UPI0029C72741|nr:serine hydrolase [Desulfogranum marinum]
MQRGIPFFLFLCFLCSLFHVQDVAAMQLPVLENSAKTRPGAQTGEAATQISAPSHPTTFGRTASQNQVNSTSAVISLGEAYKITAVKRRIGTPTKEERVHLPKINKQISSKCVMVMDAVTGETIFAKSPDTPRQPASTIKVLTGSIALKLLEKREKVGVSQKASRMPSSKVYLDPKKDYLATDLINAVLLASANDASVALAEKIAGNEKKFAYMMTLRAKLWGAKRTICKTASGLTAKGQQSTARDLANIFRHAMQNAEFARRMKKRKVVTTEGKTLYNHNKALWRVKGTQAGKTGYTSAARQTYVGQFSRDGERIVVAIMGSETMWSDVKKLVDYGFKKKQQLRYAKAAASPPAAAIN